MSFDDIPDHVNLAQQWFYIGKVADGSAGRDFGGRIDVIYGTDAQKTQAFGNPGAGVRGFGFYDASLDHGYYGWAIPQAYVEVGQRRPVDEDRSLLHPHRVRSDSGDRQLLPHPLVHDVQQRAVYAHRRPGDLLRL